MLRPSGIAECGRFVTSFGWSADGLVLSRRRLRVWFALGQ